MRSLGQVPLVDCARLDLDQCLMLSEWHESELEDDRGSRTER
jgi:hypothetical protein